MRNGRAKRLRKPVDGRCFKVVGGGKSYGFVRVKDRFESRIEREEQEYIGARNKPGDRPAKEE